MIWSRVSCLVVFCFNGRCVKRRVRVEETRFSGEFKGRRKPIKRFISCPRPPEQYSFCCFLINGKPVKKFSLDTTTAASIHFPRIPSYPFFSTTSSLLHSLPHLWAIVSFSFFHCTTTARYSICPIILFFTVLHPENGDRFHRNTSLFISL